MNMFSRYFMARRCFSSIVSIKKQEDAFTNPVIHEVLRVLSAPDAVTAHTSELRQNKNQSIKLLPNSELIKLRAFGKHYTRQKMQMPPIVTPKHEVLENLVIEKDELLQGVLPNKQKVVFTDISLSTSRKNRLIVMRDCQGTLRHADHDERKRINQVYFPFHGRRLRMPRMFQDDVLKNLLDRTKCHAYALHRASVQFEPDDLDYHRVCNLIYEHAASLSSPKALDGDSATPVASLRKTRYFGPMVLHLIAHEQLPVLLLEALARQSLADVGRLLFLQVSFHPSSNFAKCLTEEQRKLLETISHSSKLTHDEHTDQWLVEPLEAATLASIRQLTQLFIEKGNIGQTVLEKLTLLLNSCE